MKHFMLVSVDTVDSTLIKLRAGRPWVRNSGGERDLSLLHKSQSDFQVQPALLVACIKASFTLSLVIVGRTRIKKKICCSASDICNAVTLSTKVHICCTYTYQCYIIRCGIRIPNFLYPSRLTVGPTQHPVYLELGLFPGGKKAGRWR